VNTSSFGKLFSCVADGAIYSQPLWVAGVSIAGVTHNVVFVATAHDSLFAFDADASPCQTLWSVSLIDANHGATSGETTVPAGTTGNLVGAGDGDITPEVGVIGTPVIDPSTGTLYVVSKSVSASQTTFYQRLHAIDITTGKEKTGSPVVIAGSVSSSGGTVNFSPQFQNQRAGLAFNNGTVYIAWGSHEDADTYYGWVMAYTYSAGAFTQTAVFNDTPNVQFGGIWMSGGAPAMDEYNNVYVITGNGGFDASSPTPPNNDYGDTFLQMTTGLRIEQYYTPSDQASDAAGDLDFGAGGTVVLADLPPGSPVTHIAMGGGKDGKLMVLNRDSMGGYDVNDNLYWQQITVGPIYATGAYWNDTYYLAPANNPLMAYQLNTSTAQFSLASTANTPSLYVWPGSGPSVSANGLSDGIVWGLNTSQYCTNQSGGCGPAILYAYDATNLANELWDSTQVSSDAAGNAVKFTVPTVANGKVYVGTRGNNTGGVYGSTSVSGELEVYGLKTN
jgi:hypothetical protein